MHQTVIIQELTSALPPNKYGLSVIVVKSEDRPEIEISRSQINSPIIANIVDNVNDDINKINELYPNEYSEYVIAIDKLDGDVLYYGKHVFK